jgi:cell division septal protein FtsQ
MNPRRQVRRTGVRPNPYARHSQRSSGGRKPSFNFRAPAIQVSWVRWAAVATVILLALVLFAQATKLQKTTITGAAELEVDHLQRVAEEGIGKQWFGRNSLLINTAALGGFMEKAEPGIKQASVKHKGLHGIEIVVVERQPSLNWKTNGTLYLLDADGTVIGPSKGTYVKLPTVVDSSNLPVKVGDRVAPAAFVTFCKEFLRDLPATGLQASEVTVPETTSEVVVKTTKGYSLKLDTTRQASGELADLRAVQKELTRSRKTPKEYIDLRIEHKAYYK